MTPTTAPQSARERHPSGRAWTRIRFASGRCMPLMAVPSDDTCPSCHGDLLRLVTYRRPTDPVAALCRDCAWSSTTRWLAIGRKARA